LHNLALKGLFRADSIVVLTCNINLAFSATIQRGLYVDYFENILGDEVQENALLQLAKDYNIDYFTLYGNHLWWSRYAEIASFLQKAKDDWGISRIGVAGESLGDFNHAALFNDQHTERFDDFVTEFEFWGSDPTFTYSKYLQLLVDMRTLAEPREITVTTYLGKPTESEAQEIASRVDRVLLHYYVNDPNNAYYRVEPFVRGYVFYSFRNRLTWLARSSANPIEIWPIFSAEAPPYPSFMGDWLKTNSMAAAENIYLSDFQADSGDWKDGVTLSGFQYFAYTHLLSVNHPPVAARNTPSNVTVNIEPGTNSAFIVNGSDQDGNLRGAEWYLNGVHQASHFDMSGSSDLGTWSHTFTSGGTYEVAVMIFDSGVTNLYSNVITWTVVVRSANTPPVLSNPRVSPLSGTTSTNFEFLVDYYDPDGDPPHSTYRTVTITGGYVGTMTLESGSASDGTYHYVTTLPQGSYSYMFFFSDINNEHDQTPFYSGPYVYGTGNVPINIEIKCEYIAQDLELEYSLVSNTGPWTELIISGQFLDPLLVPAGATVYFHASTASANYDFQEWNLYEDGKWKTSGSGGIWGITLGTATTSVDLDVRYDYTPQNYTISGTVLRGDGSPVPEDVELRLESPEQSTLQHSTDGNFSFSNIRGGVSVSITPTADGYEFAPPALVYNNLHNNHTGETINAGASDVQVPMTSFLMLPSSVNDNSSVSFSWIGMDNVTDSANLVYQYKLDGSDTDWSDSSSSTSKSYDLANGVYTFRVRGQDEAGNINQAPFDYTFVVNAAPKVVAAYRIDNSVWASRVTLEMPVGASNPSDTFVLLPEHSGISDPEIVPVAIHEIGEDTPSGINEILSSEIGEPVRISKAESGWLVALPQSISAGDIGQYDVVWGKIEYFGWQEFVDVPYGFPNVGQQYPPLYSDRGKIEDAYLDDDQHIWRIASRDRRYSSTYGDQKAWSLMNVFDGSASIVDESIVLYLPGIPDDGSYGEKYYIQRGDVAKVASNFFLMTRIEKYEKINVGGSSEDHDYEGYRLRAYDSNGNAINTYDAQWEDEYVSFPPSSIANNL
jgi:Y_Y_Y domain